MYRRAFRSALGGLLSFAAVALAQAQAPSDVISVKAIAEIEIRAIEHGREVTKLAPADRLGSGDGVLYTLEVRNNGVASARAPTVTYPVPLHLTYVADSAVGPGSEITYSVDGGRSFDSPENLKVPGEDGQLRLAGAADYTHIRWHLKNALKGNSVAFVRFRARVK